MELTGWKKMLVLVLGFILYLMLGGAIFAALEGGREAENPMDGAIGMLKMAAAKMAAMQPEGASKPVNISAFIEKFKG